MMTFGTALLIFLVQIPNSISQGPECLCNSTNSRCDHTGVCRCDPGWEGPLCAHCALMPGCVHGSCELPWQCVCAEGWGGRFCDKDLRACQSAPCLHGGSCVMEDSGDVTCLCADSYHGDRCQLRAGPCHLLRSPCLNGGQCEDQSGFADSFSCRCLSGFSGARCEVDVDDCALSPCANGATCTDGVNRFTCTCASGFSGRFCSVNVDECASRPCANGGRCLDQANGYRCLCRHGYAGPTCLSRAAPANHSERTLRVTLSERGPAPSLSQTQVVTVVTLGAATGALVTLTATLVLHRHCGHASCWRRWGRSSRTEKV
ncbi:protein delta homolog 2 [Periophthalmus magnuspinnatus]|uniref:protein delta homolog 2 n=1 Tax=Periophthalmus magnuspinnatus TaxID=409849 RepID=UPI002436A401|nr:protein delta homolog 2 [Periophthalmus magnuspinnatus]